MVTLRKEAWIEANIWNMYYNQWKDIFCNMIIHFTYMAKHSMKGCIRNVEFYCLLDATPYIFKAQKRVVEIQCKCPNILYLIAPEHWQEFLHLMCIEEGMESARVFLSNVHTWLYSRFIKEHGKIIMKSTVIYDI